MTQTKKLFKEMNASEIMKHIPHRYPFLFIDKVIAVDETEGTLEAIKNVSINEPFFQGHFPEEPIMPGVLIIEALAQAAAVGISLRNIEGLKVLVSIKDFKFRYPVRPGDTLKLSVKLLHLSTFGGRCKAVATVGDKICTEGEMTFSIFKKTKEKQEFDA